MVLRRFLFVLALGLARPANAAIDVQLVASSVPYLVGIEHAGDGSGRLFLVCQQGQIRIHDGSHILSTPFLDLTSLVTFGSEQGLLGVAFHPNYTANGFFYVSYIDVDGNTAIARYHVSQDPNVADPNSGTPVLAQTQPFSNHNGGQIRFGPDGMLYISLGDGGSSGDPFENGQNLGTLLGKLLRIDVTSASPYAVPGTNPFAHTMGARGEIWDLGLRNPWRFSFDRQTGDLWIGDVGQNLWEEVDVQTAGASGANFGWRRMEAMHCYLPTTDCNPGGLTLPILEYSHDFGCSVTGGFRYRGSSLTDHIGTYFFADYCSGRIWGATFANGAWHATQLLTSGLSISTFGESPDGELYLSNYGANGGLYRLVASVASRAVLSVAKTGNGQVTTSPASIECGSVCGVQLATNTVVTLTATPGADGRFIAWGGDADCVDGQVTLSGDRSCTATFTAAFNDSPLVPGTTRIKAIHITELRSRIDALRAGALLPPFAWTDPTLTAGASSVRVIHVTQLRTALNDVYVARSVAPPAYTDPALAAGNEVKAIHISELRQAVIVLE